MVRGIHSQGCLRDPLQEAGEIESPAVPVLFFLQFHMFGSLREELVYRLDTSAAACPTGQFPKALY